MNKPTPDRRRRIRSRLRSRRLRAGLGLGLVLSLGVMGTQAFWTDDVTVTGATFSTGKVDLKVNGGDMDVDLPSHVMANMFPGNSVAGLITVKNASTVPLKYTATSVATDADGKNLAGSLVVKVTNGAVTGTGLTRTCGGTALPGTGGPSLNGPLVSTGRQLAAGASEVLCVSVTLAATAPSSVQSATTSATITFTGTSDLS